MQRRIRAGIGALALFPLLAPVGAALAADPAAPLVLDADASTEAVNVMGRGGPKTPPMPPLAVKRGVVRGYVKDSQGRPLKGAVIGVRSSAIGGAYSGASAKTDAHGYYEIAAPWGAAHFYCAGYAADYGDGIAAFGLRPADGETDGFATANGLVKNWVLAPYGVADREEAQENPAGPNCYYGGSINLSASVDSDLPSSLTPGSTVEITLTPDGALLGGAPGRTIVVRKTLGGGLLAQWAICNVPVGVYKIRARLADGGALRLREAGPYRNAPFGLTPKVTTEEATLLFKAEDGKPGMATAAHGHWNECDLVVERP